MNSAQKKDHIMSKKLLIDARQSGETRVVLLSNNKLEDFDHETSHRKQLKGNVYLARVTRVEPSLQAAFVEYGGNRQGFLAFSEIHPDYYRIPVEDREKLLAEEKQHNANTEDTSAEDTSAENTSTEDTSAENTSAKNANTGGNNETLQDDDDGADEDHEAQQERRRRAPASRRYKIQEVISNHQILLIQVVKEERGNKGAALTTYLSLAGQYCVLMPNNHQGGGVSRKISNPADRKKLKAVVKSLEVSKTMAVIVRTAGSKRTKAEITRDFNYLTRQWDDIRNLTMESTAPAMIHEEGDLITRAIRDYYSTDVDEILIEGTKAFEAVKTHMKNLMPTHVKKVKAYEDENIPLFQHYQVETMLAAMHEPQVGLKSGGYLVINQTEALVAIDVNSGRATRERNLEETALKTNLEAAEEIARQLRQRDLSGLIVIDFIDMINQRNQNAVERKLKESVRSDRARIQIGDISQFGLLEMSRQRLRPSLVESVTSTCPHCGGAGLVRSVESAALQVLRSIETEILKEKSDEVTVYMNAKTALYILNHKRNILAALEDRCNIRISLEEDNSLIAPDIRVGDEQASGQSGGRRRRNSGKKPQQDNPPKESTPKDNISPPSTPPNQPAASADESNDNDKPRRRRRSKYGMRRHNRHEGENDSSVKQQEQQSLPHEAVPHETDALEAGHIDTVKPSATKAKKTTKKSAATKDKTSQAKTETSTKKMPKAKKTKKSKQMATDSAAPQVKEKMSKSASGKAAKDSRVSASSTPVNVVDVSAVKPAAKKKGWWN
jgi:ribonuclease E